MDKRPWVCPGPRIRWQPGPLLRAAQAKAASDVQATKASVEAELRGLASKLSDAPAHLVKFG